MVYAEAGNMTGIVGMFQYANTVTNNKFVILLLLSLYLVPLIYTLMRKEDVWNCMMAAGFLVTIGAVFLRVAEILTVDFYLWVCVSSLIVPVVIVFIRDNST